MSFWLEADRFEMRPRYERVRMRQYQRGICQSSFAAGPQDCE